MMSANNMPVMILAAGSGTRMRELSSNTPKPLLKVCGKTIIEHLLLRLAKAEFTNVVINTARFHEQFVSTLGDGGALGLQITYSPEGEAPLNTAGGIRHALPLLESNHFSDRFMVINADVYCDYPLHLLHTPLPPSCLGHLVMVPNPPHHPQGDFPINNFGYGGFGYGDSDVHDCASTVTFSGISILRPKLISSNNGASLGKIFLDNLSQLRGEVYTGTWLDIGTPERLKNYESLLSSVAKK